MGIYLYTLRKTKPVKTDFGPVYRYEYTDKLFNNWDDNRRSDAMATAARDRWADDYNVLVTIGKGEDGDFVYRQGKAQAVWYDSDRVSGEFVGILRKRKRGAYIQGLKVALAADRTWLRYYLCKQGRESFVKAHHNDTRALFDEAYAIWRRPYVTSGGITGQYLTLPARGSEGYETYHRLEHVRSHMAQDDHNKAKKAA